MGRKPLGSLHYYEGKNITIFIKRMPFDTLRFPFVKELLFTLNFMKYSILGSECSIEVQPAFSLEKNFFS